MPPKKKKKNDENQHNNNNNNSYRILQNELHSPDYIFRKIFRKDGPPLGDRFDSLPQNPFSSPKPRSAKANSKKRHQACQQNQKPLKRRKVYEATALDNQICVRNSTPPKKHGKGKGLMTVIQESNVNSIYSISSKNKKTKREQTKQNGSISKTIPYHQLCNQHGTSVQKHGKGKGLMAVLQLTNYAAGNYPMSVDFSNGATCPKPLPESKKQPVKGKKKRMQRKPVMQNLKKPQDKKKPLLRRKLESQKPGILKQQRKEKCELVIQGERCREHQNCFSTLLDDEELELRELQAGLNPPTCSAHFASNSVRGCSFCKDLLAKFPPSSVVMRQPLYMQPWDSSPELVKKLFKVFHFLCTYAARIHMYSFTFDEFAHAFHDKDSLLLGRTNMTLLRVLLSDVEMELSNRFIPHVIKNSKFLRLLHWVEGKKFVLHFWKRSLSPMTWTEILRQVLIAAGFCLSHGSSLNGALSKEVNLMSKYGLKPGTLKGELFNDLLLQGNNGSKVSELAKSLSIVKLNLAATTDELELLISSVLSSDITLFEKIASSAYRVRINSVLHESESDQSDVDDFGSIDDNSEDGRGYSSSDDSEFDSRISSPSNLKPRNGQNSTSDIIVIDTEIDESYPGEVWLLGLTEGEYSELSIDEKLNALVALIDLLSGGSTIRMADSISSVAECATDLNRISCGGKIKRSTRQLNVPATVGGYVEQAVCISQANKGSSTEPVDSLAINVKEKSFLKIKDPSDVEFEEDVYPMQSIYLGSDRRYNRYWLFMGPCNDHDPGHRRIYFESSEDGQWEVIDTAESLCTLLLALDSRGSREACLLSSLEKLQAPLLQAMSGIPDNFGSRQPTQSDCSDFSTPRGESSSALSDVDNNLWLSEIGNGHPVSTAANVLEIEKKREQQKHKWSRLQEFDLWVWNSFYMCLNSVKHGKKSFLNSLARCEHCHDLYWRDEKHCKICHSTFELDFDIEERYAIHTATCRNNRDDNVFPKHKVLPSQLQSLKAAIYSIESVMPEDALVGTWAKSAHNLWIKRLRRTSTLPEFLKVLADFVTSINEDWLHRCSSVYGSDSLIDEIIACFSNMPQTSSAVALWVVKLDDLIGLHLQSIYTEKDKQLCTSFEGNYALVR